MVQLRLHYRLPANDRHVETVRLPDDCVEQDIAAVKAVGAQLLGIQADTFDLFYLGRWLDENTPLSSYGVSDNSVVHALVKRQAPSGPPKPSGCEVSDARQISQLNTFLAMSSTSAPLRHAIELAQGPDHIDRLMAAVPALIDDPILLAALHNLSLLSSVISASGVKTMLERHPAMAVVAPLLLAKIQEHARRSSPGAPARVPSQAAPVAGSAYSLDNISDEEEMGEDENEARADVGGNNSSNRSVASVGTVGDSLGRDSSAGSNQSTGQVTREQLALALASAMSDNAGTSAVAGIRDVGSSGRADMVSENHGAMEVASDAVGGISSAMGGASGALGGTSSEMGGASSERGGASTVVGGASSLVGGASGSMGGTSSAESAGGVVSAEMVSAALRQAISSLPSQTSQRHGLNRPSSYHTGASHLSGASPASMQSFSSQTTPDASNVVSAEAVSAVQVLGITDNVALIRQALLISDGDVNAAVEFICNNLTG